MKEIKQPTILGIDPGSRHVGFAVFEGMELIYFGITTNNLRNKTEHLRKTRKGIKKLIKKHEVQYIGVEKVIYVQQRKSFVNDVFNDIGKTVSKDEALKLFSYSPEFVRQTICTRDNKKPIKRNLNHRLATLYPELQFYVKQGKSYQERYYSFLFGAVAVGLVCFWELNGD